MDLEASVVVYPAPWSWRPDYTNLNLQIKDANVSVAVGFCCVIEVLCLCLLVFVALFRQHARIRASAPVFQATTLVGTMFFRLCFFSFILLH